jgi:hypothetical protein
MGAFTTLVALGLLVGCGEPEDTARAPEGDVDADTDTDSDTDADTDSDTDADTDSDTDVDTGPHTELDCSDGVDNDDDGLLDCEDGDCASDEICGELICDDGLDGDGDGLTDCEDDDCMAWCIPREARVTVLGGRGTLQTRSWRESGSDTHGRFSRSGNDREFSLGSITGIVQVLPMGHSSWYGTTARTTCTWTADEVSFAQGAAFNSLGSSRWFSSATRGATDIASGCRVVPIQFLPALLAHKSSPYGDRAFFSTSFPFSGRTWARWYQSTDWLQLRSTTTSSYHRSGTSSHGHFYHFARWESSADISFTLLGDGSKLRTIW